jgi:P4 family phage/plasmid primase-like protien
MNDQRINKIYDYKDAAGSLLFQVVRFEPKGFSQRRPFEDGFIWGLTEGWYQKDGQINNYYRIKDALPDKATPPHLDAVWFDAIEPVLYRLPELRQSINTGETIYICEGEKDADNLTALGFIATTCPMGAGKWRTTYTEALRGCRETIMLADKDEPGRAHAQAVASSLYSAGVPVKVVEMPDIEGAVVKDVSDWLTTGGTREAFLGIVKECSEWIPLQDQEQNNPPELQTLIDKYGEPYYLSKDGGVTAINQAFWASLHQTEHIQLFEPDERAFYRYNPESGLYYIISEDAIKQEITSRILDISRQQGLPSLERKRTNSNLNHIVAQLKGISEKKNAFRRGNKFVHLANGVIVFKDTGEADFCSFSPDFYSRNQCPIPFNSSATCERFFNELLYPAVTPDDAVLLQKYTGLCLLGNNLIQKLLILDGKPGRGKSTLALIIQSLIGQVNVTELRTRHLNDRFELFRYLKKNLLVGVDVPGQFLSEKGAYVIKGLVGGDWFDAEQKCGTGSFPFQGNFCILITSNSRLQVRLDGDTGAWKRRLLIIRFEAPAPAKKIPDFKDVLIREEGSGILNWALQGLGMLLKDIEAHGDIQLTEAQDKIIDILLAESDSLRHFLVENVVQDENADLSTTEIVEAYAEYCPVKGWNPKPITVIYRELESLMLELFGTSKSHSIKRDDKSTKGFRRVAFKGEDKRPWD